MNGKGFAYFRYAVLTGIPCWSTGVPDGYGYGQLCDTCAYNFERMQRQK